MVSAVSLSVLARSPAVAEGNATIACALSISLKTVRNHVSNIFTKLQVTDRSAAIVKAREAGFASPPERA